MSRKRWFFDTLLALILTFCLLAASTGSALAKKDKPPRMDPDFLQLVQDHPDELFKVIVQKDAKNKDLKEMEPEELVKKGGGQVRKQLDLIVSFAAEMSGREIEKLAKNPKVRWISPDAPVVSTGVKPGTRTYRDEFNSVSYSGYDGTENWRKTPWVEFGESNGPGSGDIEVLDDGRCASGKCLELECDGMQTWGVYRPVNLDGVASANLTFQYMRAYESTTGSLLVQVSADDGATWTTLDPLALDIGDSDQQSAQYNLAPYASADTVIRFMGTDDGHIHIDNFQIEYQFASPYREVVHASWVPEFDGQGVTVAVIDSGISPHVDFGGPSNVSRIVGNTIFGNYDSPEDQYAHGTHVAGIIGGDGTASGGEHTGIAPGVNLVNVRVSNDLGMTYTSDVVDGMQWLYDNKDAHNIRVVNLSVNSTVPESYHTSPLSAACEILWFNGIVVVVAAGNNGTTSGPSTLYPPANDPFVITVGALEDIGTTATSDDFVADFSAYGVTEDGFAKPELVAPGRNIVSTLAGTDVTAYLDYEKHHVDDFYFRMSGTSMAAPVVSGVVAMLLQDEPGLNPDQVKYRLMDTANQYWANYSALKAGAGLVDAEAAVYGSSTGSANQGIIPSNMLTTGDDPVAFGSVGWNSVGWNSVGWNSVGWNSVGWNSVGWNSVGWNSVGWNTSTWDD